MSRARSMFEKQRAHTAGHRQLGETQGFARRRVQARSGGTMTRHSTRFVIAFAFVSILGSARASAQESPRSRPAEPLVFGTGASYEVKFDDDPLGALSNDVII